jgi:hypothetical protein
MTYQIDSAETGNTFTYPDQAAYEQAEAWYNRLSKAAIVVWCAQHGLDLVELTDDPNFPSGRRLVMDWADIAMQRYAQEQAKRLEAAEAVADRDFVLVTSGDGWSLHAPGSTNADIALGNARYLISGPDTPSPADYAAARRQLIDNIRGE